VPPRHVQHNLPSILILILYLHIVGAGTVQSV
jgi:hypothetical protein